MTFRKTAAVAAPLLALSLLLWPACNNDFTPCEGDIDCLVQCNCEGRLGSILVGPYACRLGTCGREHAEERDCVRACGEAPPAPGDDDDSSLQDDDDSSLQDDDDSAALDDDDSAR